MRRFLLMLGFATGLLCGGLGLAAPHCDIPGAAFKGMKMESAEDCEKVCGDDAKCAAWVYVSGWGYCSLKEKARKPRPLKIWAAKRGEAAQAERDNSGKDFKKISHVEEAAACQALCEKTPGCLGMAYLDGYRDCYLKNTEGKVSPKIFYCGESPKKAGLGKS